MLRLLGLDIGTTTISAAVIDGENGKLLHSETVSNGADEPSENGYNKTQSVEIIARKLMEVKNKLLESFAPISAIGVTGQMHGILYYDQNGKAVSPLYTWQDKSGELEFCGTTYAKYLSEKTGYKLASGYGLVTDFVLRSKEKVPSDAVGFTTVHDYIVMLLTGRKRPLMHSTDAASLGCFSIEKRAFDSDALKAIGTPESFLPEVTDDFAVAGESDGIPVAVAIGDNQASIIGVASENQKVFVNIGTGSQVSVITDKAVGTDGTEIRPFVNSKNLVVGAPLFGGRSYSLLKRFFEECASAFGGNTENIYGIMDRLSEENPKEHSLKVDTRFAGTRSNPDIKGSVSDISEDNFTVAQLTKGFLWGMAQELFDLYGLMKSSDDDKLTTMVGSGNAIRKSAVLQSYLEEQFGLRLNIPKIKEEASSGAAFFAAVAAQCYKSLEEAQSINVKY